MEEVILEQRDLKEVRDQEMWVARGRAPKEGRASRKAWREEWRSGRNCRRLRWLEWSDPVRRRGADGGRTCRNYDLNPSDLRNLTAENNFQSLYFPTKNVFELAQDRPAGVKTRLDQNSHVVFLGGNFPLYLDSRP